MESQPTEQERNVARQQLRVQRLAMFMTPFFFVAFYFVVDTGEVEHWKIYAPLVLLQVGSIAAYFVTKHYMAEKGLIDAETKKISEKL